MSVTKISLEDSILSGELSLERIFDAFTDGVYDYNIEEKITFVSDNFFRLLGYDPGEFTVTDERWDDLIHPEDLEESSRLFYDHIEGRSSRYIAEYRVLRKDGSYQWVSCTGQLIGKNKDGKPDRVVGAIKSIQSKKQLEVGMKTLIHASSKLKGKGLFTYMTEQMASLFQVNYAIVTITNERAPQKLQPLVLWANGSFDDSYEYSIVGTPTEQVYHSHKGLLVYGDLTKNFPQDAFIRDHSIVGYYGIPIHNPTNEVIGHLCVMNDKEVIVRPWMESIIELFAKAIGSEVVRIENEEKLRKANKILDGQVQERTNQLEKAVEDLDSFFYKASHDLRAPITTLEGIYNLIESEINTEEKAKLFRMLGFQITNIKKLNRSIIEVGNIRNYEMVPRNIHVKSLIDEIVAQQFIPKGMTVEVDIIDTLIIKTDSFLLSTLLRELISNSIVHRNMTSNESYSKISSIQEGNMIYLMIDDNGKGISNRYEQNYFQLFMRASTTSSGYGLGLYKAKLAAEKSGIDLSIDTEEGAGTSVTLQISNQ